ncbi:hypothetical protein N9I58_02225 [Candidatus Thioglobus sp.]|nr:hypothetical protein [Candidatus Thioglobus sp.]
MAGNTAVFTDVAFAYILDFFSLFTDSKELVIKCTQFFIAFLFLFYGYLAHASFTLRHRDFNNESVMYVFLLVIMSVAFSLGVNNGLRQATSGILVLYLLFLLIERKYFLSVLMVLPIIYSHGSGIYFFGAMLIFYIFLQAIYFNAFLGIKFSNTLTLFFVVMGGIICGLMLQELVIYSKQFINYADKVLVLNNERVLLSFKIIPIMFIFLFSEILAGKYSSLSIHMTTLRFFRAFFLFLILVLSFFANLDELGARMLYYYFLIEMALIVYFWLNKNKFASVFIIFSYSLATNAMHILAGHKLL